MTTNFETLLCIFKQVCFSTCFLEFWINSRCSTPRFEKSPFFFPGNSLTTWISSKVSRNPALEQSNEQSFLAVTQYIDLEFFFFLLLPLNHAGVINHKTCKIDDAARRCEFSSPSLIGREYNVDYDAAVGAEIVDDYYGNGSCMRRDDAHIAASIERIFGTKFITDFIAAKNWSVAIDFFKYTYGR